jgi:hypothetical protein
VIKYERNDYEAGRCVMVFDPVATWAATSGQTTVTPIDPFSSAVAAHRMLIRTFMLEQRRQHVQPDSRWVLYARGACDFQDIESLRVFLVRKQ